MNKFSRKIISLLSSCCLLGASFSGVKAMINRIEIGSDSDSDDENNIREPEREQILVRRRNYELRNFGYAWETDRDEYKQNRERVLNEGEKNRLTMLPYDVTNIVSNNPKKTTATIVAAGALAWWLLRSSDTYDYEDEEDDYDNIK